MNTTWSSASGCRSGTNSAAFEPEQVDERLYRFLVDHVPEVTMLLTEDLTVVYASPMIERFLGYRTEEVVGTKLSWYLHPEADKPTGSGLLEIQASGRTTTPVELRLRHADGTWRHFEVSASALPEEVSPQRIGAYFRDVTEERTSRDALIHRSMHDPLTDLPNRALFSDRLEHALARTVREQKPVTVLFVDLDDFKAINDDFGHETGDQLLLAISRRLRACVRPEDTVARLGGDEFAIILERSLDTERIVDRILDASRTPVVVQGSRHFVTASIGVATSAPDLNRASDLLKCADWAMYKAKDKGKDRWELYTKDLSEETRERLDVRRGFARALERGELRVYYQPSVDPETGKIAGMEALLRWESPQLGLISPAGLLNSSDMEGQVWLIERWVLEEACRQAREWQEQCREEPPFVSVNLSKRRLQQPTLGKELSEVLQATGLSSSKVALEISEDSWGSDQEWLTTAARDLESLGVPLVIDNFGKGNFSLSYLEQVPVNLFKIDSSFVHRLGQDKISTMQVVSAMVAFGQGLGVQVVAKGVETERQLKKLIDMDCDLVQGFLFSEPLPGEAASKLLIGGGTI